jgi:uncharacterized protein YdiU (UPF0061 family)
MFFRKLSDVNDKESKEVFMNQIIKYSLPYLLRIQKTKPQMSEDTVKTLLNLKNSKFNLTLANPMTMYSYGIEPDYVELQNLKLNKFKDLKEYNKDNFEEEKIKALSTWLDNYLERLASDKREPLKLTDEILLFLKYPLPQNAFKNLLFDDNNSKLNRKELMNKLNPKFILRNHVAQKVIEKAEDGQYEDMWKLLDIMNSPFNEHDEITFEGQYDTSTVLAYNICVSCSS